MSEDQRAADQSATPLGGNPDAAVASSYTTVPPSETGVSAPHQGDIGMLAAGATPLPGYRLVKLLGKGGFGEVWNATGPGGFSVALKFIRLDGVAGTIELRSLELMKSVSHGHLLPMFGAWQIGGFLIVAMELAQGTLSDELNAARQREEVGIPADLLIEYMRDAAKGIDFLNERRHPSPSGDLVAIQHKDIKPQNLLVVGGTVKVADFGLARVMQHTVTAATGCMTPAYAAPEFFESKATRWSDQYSLAISYCQLRGGRLPFGGSAFEVMAGHVSRFPDLSMIPEAERIVVARALAKKSEERWPDCRTFVDALAGAIHGKSTTASSLPQAIPPAVQVPRSKWRHVRGRLIAGIVAIVIVSCGLLMIGRSHRFPSTSLDFGKPGVDSSPGRPEGANAQAELVLNLGNDVKMGLMLIKAGSFWMGSPDSDNEASPDEKPRHRVTLTRDFYLGKFPVTQGQYRRITGKTPSFFSARGGGKEQVQGMNTRHFPVETVSWDDANAFCAALSQLTGRRCALPTEAQWEYACRAGSETRFYFGDNAKELGDLEWYKANSGERTHEVGTRKPNAFGLFDMTGNVWEWCQDRYGQRYYENANAEDPQGPAEGDARVLRGGSWRSRPRDCRSAYRNGNDPASRTNFLGFRIAIACE